MDWVFPFLLLYAHLAFSPLPWQWSGDEAPRVGMGRGFVQALVFNVAWVAALLTLTHLADRTGHPRPPAWERPPMPPPGRFHPLNPGWGLGLVNVAFAIAFGWVMAEKEATEVRERWMAGLLRQSQSRALQNQLEPHVLYNALNGLSELVYEDPLAAEEVITRLADLYRMLTVHGNEDRVPLAAERRLVEAYLAMEQMRLGDRLRVAWTWPETCDGVLLPPFFLQTLVENAIKHGISPCDQGGEVRIACGREGTGMRLTVENDGCPLPSGFVRGVGLGNLEARLALWAEATGAFTLDRRGDWTVATLRWTPKEPA